jgi:hypothetical protein
MVSRIGVSKSVCTIQNKASQSHHHHDQAQDNHDSQSVGFGFLSVIAGNNGIQQMVDVTAVYLIYVKLHTIFSAQIRPSGEMINPVTLTNYIRKMILPLTISKRILKFAKWPGCL